MADIDRIVELDGDEYRMGKMTLGVMTALKEAMRLRRRTEFAETLKASGGDVESETARLQAYAAAIAGIGPPEEQLKSMERLVKDGISERVKGIREISREDISEGELNEEINQFWGMQFVFHRLLLKNYPDLTFEQVGNMIGADEVDELTTILFPGSANDENPTETPPPPQETT